MHLKLLLGASLAIAIVIGGLAILQIPQNEAQLGENPRPDSVPLAAGGDLEISVDEAGEWAARSDFDFKLPSDTLGLVRQSMMLRGIGPKAPDNQELIVGHLRILYSKQPISPEMTQEQFWREGGLSLLIAKKSPLFEDQMERKREYSIVTFVHGNLALYGPPIPEDIEPMTTLTWGDGRSKFELVASANHFSMEDLVSIARSVQ